MVRKPQKIVNSEDGAGEKGRWRVLSLEEGLGKAHSTGKTKPSVGDAQ